MNMQSRLLASLALVTIPYAAWLGGHEPTGFSVIATGIVAIAGLLSLLAMLRGWARVKEAITSSLLLLMAFMVASDMLGVKLLSWSAFHDSRYATVLSSILVITAVGIQLRWFVSRWLALALACAGIGSAGLNLLPWYAEPCAYTWTLALHIAGALIVIANLVGSETRERFEEHASPLWSSTDPVLRSIRWTILAFFAAIPMLLVYGWMQPVVPTTQMPALALAGFLSISIALSISRRVLGALGLVLGGIALLAQASSTLFLAYDMSDSHGWIALYYAAFWIPAGLAALHCGARLMGPLLKLLYVD
jgi:hypothetical protein